MVEDAGRWRGVAMDGPTLRLVDAAVVDLPRPMWAVNHMGEEKLAA